MKKTLSIIIGVTVLLSALSVAALAGPPTHVEGLWQYSPTIVDLRMADGNTFLTTTEEGIWTGNIEGESREEGKVVIHSTGAWSFRGTVFFEGNVNGKEGTIEMHVVGKRPDELTEWQGKWTITVGTGELASLTGQGIWWGPGAAGPGSWGDIYYEGKVKFTGH